jgi:hypothetical protein
MAEKIDIETLKQNIIERERQRKQEAEKRATDQRRANLDKQAKAEIEKREKSLKSLANRIISIEGRISELTKGGKVSSELRLKQNIDSYNEAIDLQDKLSKEISSITKGDYKVVNNEIVVQAPVKETTVKQESLPGGFKQATETPKTTTTPKVPTAPKTPTTPRTPPAQPELPSGKKDGKSKDKPLTIQQVYELARSKFGNVDSIFLYDPELQDLLRKAVNQDYEESQFLKELGATDWAQRGATIYRNREAEKREYEGQLGKLQKQLELATDPQRQSAIQEKIDELKTQSNYARGLERTKGIIQNVVTQVGARYNPEQLDLLVRRIYDSASEGDINKITNIVSGNIGYASGAVLGGLSGESLTDLRRVAKANGLDLDKVYKSNINDWLGRIAQGESIETFKNVIRQQAKLGLPEKVASLLDQGLDLEQIYAPYKNLMASYLEIPSQNIDLNDRTLRSAIGPDKEMSLYDFERSLRNDSRWEYTNNAREEVSSNVLSILKNFGFQG